MGGGMVGEERGKRGGDGWGWDPNSCDEHSL